MSKITNVFIFASGLAIGSVVTWKLLDAKYEQLIQDEIESMKDMFEKKYSDNQATDEEVIDEPTISEAEGREAADSAKEKPSIIEYASVLQKSGYTDYSGVSKKEEPDTKINNTDAPYVIAPEEFGEFEEYAQIGLTYYSDGVLTDDNNDIIEDVDNVVGLESLSHFGEYEDDSVHVRNDRLKCDYEILQVSETYSNN